MQHNNHMCYLVVTMGRRWEVAVVASVGQWRGGNTGGGVLLR